MSEHKQTSKAFVLFLLLFFLQFVCYCMSQKCVCVSQGQVCSDNCTCCHTDLETADQTFYLTQSQYIDTALTLCCQAPGRVTNGVPILKSLVRLDLQKIRKKKAGTQAGSATLKADAFTLHFLLNNFKVPTRVLLWLSSN